MAAECDGKVRRQEFQRLVREKGEEWLAERCGVTVRTILAWARRGLPKSGNARAELDDYLRRREAAKKRKAKPKKAKPKKAKPKAEPKKAKPKKAKPKAEPKKAEPKAEPKAPAKPVGTSRLEKVVKQLGLVEAARELQVTKPTVKRWLERGLSAKGLGRLDALEVELKRRRQDEKRELAEFNHFLKVSGESVYYPSIRTREGKASGPRTQRYQWTRGINRRLTEALIAELVEWARSLGREQRWPRWQAVAIVSMFGGAHSDKIKPTVGRPVPGTGGHYISVWIIDPQSDQFKADTPPTKQKLAGLKQRPLVGEFSLKIEIPTFGSKSLAKVSADFERLLRLAFDEVPFVFVHGATVYNWRVRTPAQRKSLETTWRHQRRRKQWKSESKKTKKTKKGKRGRR